jgi:hypothetical protein
MMAIPNASITDVAARRRSLEVTVGQQSATVTSTSRPRRNSGGEMSEIGDFLGKNLLYAFSECGKFYFGKVCPVELDILVQEKNYHGQQHLVQEIFWRREYPLAGARKGPYDGTIIEIPVLFFWLCWLVCSSGNLMQKLHMRARNGSE